MTVPIARPIIGQAERENVMAVLDSGHLAEGDVVRQFEREFAAYCTAEHAVATTNGTTALHAAIEALDLEPKTSILTTPFSFVATANAIRLAGHEPVFVDIDEDTYAIDPDRLADRLESTDRSIEAIIVVHLYGLTADMDPILDIAAEYDIPVIEDAAQAHGATYRGRIAGSIGDIACFSFYPTKNMTTGEGGMIVTKHEAIADRLRRFIDHGRGRGRYEHPDLGHNFRMTNIAAAIGRAQLDRLPGFIADRRENAARLTEALSEAAVVTPTEPTGCRHVYHQYTIRSDRRDRIRERLAEADIDSAVYYPTPIHQLESYADIDASAPIAERVADEVLSVPVHPGVKQADIDRIAAIVTGTVTSEVHP